MALLDWSVPVSSLVNKLQENGYKIYGVNDSEKLITIHPNHSNLVSRKKAVDIIVSVDESTLVVTKDNKTFGLFIVLGNEPDELVADYHSNDDLERVVEEFSSYWEGKKCPTIKE
jgi:hypothetical protein